MGKSTFLDEVQAQMATPGAHCKLSKIYAKMPPEDLPGLIEVLENPEVQATAIAKALTKREFPISDAAVKRCRQHACWKEI